MNATICALIVLLAQGAEKELLPSRLELAQHKRHVMHVLDPLFVRVTFTNTTKQRVAVSPDLFKKARYGIEGFDPPFHCTYSYDPIVYPGGGSPISVPIASGEKATVDYQILELPPAELLTTEIWRRVIRDAPPYVYAHVYGHLSEVPIQLRSEAKVFLGDRPPEEMKFLNALYGEMLKRKQKKDRMPKGFDFSAPYPYNFGLRSFKPYPDLVEKLVAYEEHLSPGSLRDVVHLLAVMRKLYYSKSQAENERLVNDLLQWLDTLPEIERHCLVERIRHCLFHFIWRDEPAFNRLVYETIQRLPESLYGRQDYRAQKLTDFNRPGFQTYLEQRRREKKKEE